MSFVCVYVGQSECLNNRLISHPQMHSGAWISWLEFDRRDVLYAEAFYIGVLRPERNFGNVRESHLPETTGP